MCMFWNSIIYYEKYCFQISSCPEDLGLYSLPFTNEKNCLSLSLKRPGLLPDVYGKYENDWSSVQIVVLLSCRSWRLKAWVRFKSASLLTNENQICMNFRESILLNSKRECLELPSLIQTGNVFNSVLSDPLWLHAAFFLWHLMT